MRGDQLKVGDTLEVYWGRDQITKIEKFVGHEFLRAEDLFPDGDGLLLTFATGRTRVTRLGEDTALQLVERI